MPLTPAQTQALLEVLPFAVAVLAATSVFYVIVLAGVHHVLVGWTPLLWEANFYATEWKLDRLSAFLRRRLPDELVHAQIAYFAYRRGDMEEALRTIDAAIPRALPDPLAWNVLMNVLIGAGRYREALAGLDQPWRSKPRNPLRRWYHAVTMLSVQLNEAEALSNLGETEQALHHVTATARGAAGASIQAMHDAWFHAARADLPRAWAAHRRIRVRHIPAEWRSEGHFASAFVHLLADDPDAAELATRSGLAVARRASSRRNGQFLLATIARRRGDTDAAMTLFSEAADHAYRGQGGHALLEWGDLCAELGRDAEAARAWSLVVERDPESAAASLARTRRPTPRVAALDAP